MKLKTIGITLVSSALSFGIFSSAAGATTFANGQPEKIQIQVAATETAFTKNDLIKKFHELFPKQFDFLTNNDFQMHGSHFYPEDDTLRYSLSFTKVIDGKRLYGHVGFVGDKLEIENYSYQPPNEKEALFPAKVSKDEARKIADNFMKKFLNEGEYQLEANQYNYYPQQILTEPIRYSFSFARTKNQVAINDQRIEVTVLGNGEIVGFYKNSAKLDSSTYDDVKLVKDKNDILKNVKENLSVDLQYQVDMDYRTGESRVQLVYQPTLKMRGVNAISGEYLTTNGYSADFPEKTKLEKVSANPLPPRKNGITVEEAKKIAEQLLSIKSDKVKLSIDSISEMENYNGQEVISINYMYQYANSGTGSNIEFNKQTGEILQYHSMKSHILEQIGEKPNKDNAISKQEALEQAVNYVKEWVPSYLHNYAMPLEDPYTDDILGTYNFSFPRVVNGILVMGDQINVGIAADGSLINLYVTNYQKVENWPSIDKVISEENAKTILKDALSLKLNYMKKDYKQENKHYDLVYVPVFNEDSFTFLDANTGRWNSLNGVENTTVISHPWAEEELNYLINAKILDVKDSKKFNGDAAISKGEAIKVVMNSLTYFYAGGYYGERDNLKQTFDNIDPKHPLYQPIERAVEMGIIKPTSKSFDVDSPIKREELAAWYIRVLGLEQAAKHNNIYKLGFADANKVQKEYTGYVALVSAMGILESDKNNFNPTREVTYAELAASTIRLAHEMAEKRNGYYY